VIKYVTVSLAAIEAAKEMGLKGPDVEPAIRLMARHAAPYRGSPGLNKRFNGIGFLMKDGVVLHVCYLPDPGTYRVKAGPRST
jgi:hypothetical protein